MGEYFRKLVNLRELNLAENKIEKIENLTHCSVLKSLFLYTNQIKVIEGLEGSI